MEQIILWLIMLLANLAWGFFNSLITQKGYKTFHGWSAAIYMVLCIPILFYTLNWLNKGLLISSFLMLHACVFPIFYNYMRNLPVFNLSTTTTSIFDRFQVWIGLKSSVLFNISAFIISVILLTLSIKL